MKPRKPSLVWLLPLTALVVIAGWLLRASRATPRPSTTPAAAATEPAGVPDEARPEVEARLRAVEATVAEKNREATQDRGAFLNAGWKLVSTTPPDARVIGYDPKLLDDGRERALKMQLLSTVPSPEQAARVAEIARRAKEPATRYAAVEALGHLNAAPEALSALYDLLVNGQLDPSDPARQDIPALLRPSALDDPMATQVAKLLDSGALTTVEKKQIAFTLSLIGLRDGMTLPADVLASLSPEARALLDQMTALAKSSFVKALTRQGGQP